MPNLQPPASTSSITSQRYLQLVEQAWQGTQGRAPRTAMRDDDAGRAAESGRSAGPLQDRPGQRFARLLLQSLEQAGCTQIKDALRVARALEEP